MSPVKRRPRATRPLRVLHRWVGVSAAVFLLLLCVSGLLLNHAAALGLDSRFVGFGWLLERYGYRSDAPGPSFDVDGRWVTYLDERLYLDSTPVVGEFTVPVGAVRMGAEIVVATANQLIALGPTADVLETWPLPTNLGVPLTGVAPDPAAAEAMLVETARGRYRIDWNRLGVEPVAGTADVDWIAPTAAPADLVSAIQRDYRGRGVSWERLIADIHSGRLAGLSGVVVMDLAALALLVLAISGILLWWRR